MAVSLPHNWYLAYLGKPWEATPCPPESYNCGELVRSVHRDMVGIDSPAIPITDAHSRLQCLKAMQPDIFGLLPLPDEESPRSLDVAFLGRQNRLAHCGMVVETAEGLRVLHCPQCSSGVVLDDLLQLRLSGFPVVRWFRHKDMSAALRSRGWL